MIEKDELIKKIEDLKEEVDYYEKKVVKIEVDNKTLRLGNNQYKRVKELEDEVEALKQQSHSFNRVQLTEQSSKAKAGKDLSKDE